MYNEVRYTAGNCTVTIEYAKLRVREEPLYAADGRTQEGTRFNLSFTGVIAESTQALFAERIRRIRNTLSRPRGTIVVRWSENNVDWNQTYGFEEGSDINHGPKPGPCEITDFSGGLAALYSWSIEVTVKDCFTTCTGTALAETPGTTENILSLSRSYAHDVDANGMTTRRVSGKLVVTSGSVMAGRGGDWWRDRCMPSLPSNFNRESVSSQVSEDQRTLTFSCTDKERLWTLPKPVSSGEASYMVRQEGVGGLSTYAVSGRFTAPATVSKRTILLKIADLVISRIPEEFVIWQSRTITESVYENTISFDISWTAAVMETQGTSVADYSKVGLRPPESDGAAQPIGAYGGDGEETSGVMADRIQPYEACSGGNAYDNSGADRSQSAGDAGGSWSVVPDPGSRDLAADNTGGSQELSAEVTPNHASAPYIAYHERLCWLIDNHIVSYPSKVKGKPPIVQQTANPTCILLQAGYATRWGTLNLFPFATPPLYGPDEAKVSTASREYRNPIPLGVPNQFEMSVSWAYRMELLTSPADEVVDFRPPADPRMTTTADDALADAFIDSSTDIVVAP